MPAFFLGPALSTPILSWWPCSLFSPFHLFHFKGENTAYTIGGAGISEDCLYLNVFAPLDPNAPPAPVLIFFYGGSWESGSGSCPLYFGTNLIGQTQDAVVREQGSTCTLPLNSALCALPASLSSPCFITSLFHALWQLSRLSPPRLTSLRTLLRAWCAPGCDHQLPRGKLWVPRWRGPPRPERLGDHWELGPPGPARIHAVRGQDTCYFLCIRRLCGCSGCATQKHSIV